MVKSVAMLVILDFIRHFYLYLNISFIPICISHELLLKETGILSILHIESHNPL
jgi:hypothetical protein